MKHLTEIQTLKQSLWPLLLVAGILIPVNTMMIVDIASKEVVEYGDILGISFSLVISGLSFWLLLTMKTHLELRPDGIHYQSSPFRRRLKHLPLEQIRAMSIVPHKWFHGLGYRYTLGGGTIIVMQQGPVLKVTTRAGKKFRFGINRKSAVLKFLREEWQKKPGYVE